jgi:hypothetical protein
MKIIIWAHDRQMHPLEGAFVVGHLFNLDPICIIIRHQLRHLFSVSLNRVGKERAPLEGPFRLHRQSLD